MFRIEGNSTYAMYVLCAFLKIWLLILLVYFLSYQKRMHCGWSMYLLQLSKKCTHAAFCKEKGYIISCFVNFYVTSDFYLFSKAISICKTHPFLYMHLKHGQTNPVYCHEIAVPRTTLFKCT